MRAPPIVRLATDVDAIALAAVLRQEQAFRILAESGRSLEEVITESIARSIETWVWEVDGAPACMVGFASKSLIGSRGVIAWMFTTPTVEAQRRVFWAGCKRLLPAILERYGRIDGHCDSRFLQSVQWLKRLGFDLDPPEEFMGVPFCHFSKEFTP